MFKVVASFVGEDREAAKVNQDAGVRSGDGPEDENHVFYIEGGTSGEREAGKGTREGVSGVVGEGAAEVDKANMEPKQPVKTYPENLAEEEIELEGKAEMDRDGDIPVHPGDTGEGIAEFPVHPPPCVNIVSQHLVYVSHVVLLSPTPYLL